MGAGLGCGHEAGKVSAGGREPSTPPTPNLRYRPASGRAAIAHSPPPEAEVARCGLHRCRERSTRIFCSAPEKLACGSPPRRALLLRNRLDAHHRKNVKRI